jgi:hypothetical protein
MRGGDRARGGFAIACDPAPHQPVRRVEHRGVERGEAAGTVLGHSPQHGVDQAGIARGMAVGLREPHREIDRGMVGHIEKQDLRGAHQQRRLDLRRLARQPAFEMCRKQMAQRAEPPQHARDQGAHQGAVALGQRAKAAGFELFVERAPAPQHAVDDIGGDAPGGEPWWRVRCRRGGEGGG